MINEFVNLALTVDFLSKQEAREIIDPVISKLADVFAANIIDVIWREEGKVAPILDIFCSVDNSGRPTNMKRPFEVKEEPLGIWTWVYNNEQPLWIEKIRATDFTNPGMNLATGEEIEVKDINFYSKTDSIMAVPLKFREVLYGLICVELPFSDKLNKGSLDLLQDLAEPTANLIWKADAHELNDTQTTKVIKSFRKTAAKFSYRNTLSRHKTGFIARPFNREHEEIEKCIIDHYSQRGVQIRSFENVPGSSDVIDSMMQQIKQSHFAVIDITGLSPNVMFELGLIKSLKKTFILLKSHDDDSELPFNIQNSHYYTYRIGHDGTYASRAGTTEEIELSNILDDFIDVLRGNLDFCTAENYQAPVR